LSIIFPFFIEAEFWGFCLRNNELQDKFFSAKVKRFGGKNCLIFRLTFPAFFDMLF